MPSRVPAAVPEPLEPRRLLAAVYPTALEQLMVELINRARANPSAEAARFAIDLNEGLAPGTISPAAKQPLAINPLLTDAARGHVDWLRASGKFQHEGAGNNSPKDRMAAAGYAFTGGWGYAENLAVRIGGVSSATYAGVVEDLHRGLFRDTEIPGRGHRLNLLNASMKEIGSGVSAGSYSYNGGSPAQALLVGQDFAHSGGSFAGQSFLTGVAYTDAVVDDDFYTVGEGLAGISVSATRVADGAVFSTTTWSSGGYSLALPAGTYAVTATGPGLGGTVTIGDVVIAAQNVKRDFTPAAVAPFAVLSGGRLTVTGTAGNDAISIGVSGSTLLATLNASTLSFNAASVLAIDLFGGDGNDRIDASAAAVPVYALGGAGRDTLVGGAGSDTLTGGGGNDALAGNAGADRLNGHGGHDGLEGGEGADRLYGDDGDDALVGGGGVDRLWGGLGNDLLDGGSSNDKLFGDAGLDTLRGGRHNDYLDGGPGADQIFGNDGTDSAVTDVLDARTSVEVLT
jgi:Ca2+-binding RTX toxin-like protein